MNVEHFARPYKKGDGIANWLDSLPQILAGDSFRGVVEALQQARARRSAPSCGAWAATW